MKHSLPLTYPVNFPILAENYDYQRHCHWDTGELVGFQQDISDMKTTPEAILQVLRYNFVYFGIGEGYINDKVAHCYIDTNIPEAKCCIACQMNMEIIHSRTYVLLLLAFLQEAKMFDAFLQEASNSVYVLEKAKWKDKWFAFNHLQVRFAALACIEAIQFSGNFAIIFFVKLLLKRFPALSQIYDLISRDESNHFCFSIEMIKLLTQLYNERKLSLWLDKDRIKDLMPYVVTSDLLHEMIDEIVKLEQKCTRDLFEKCDCELAGAPVESLCKYTEAVADQVCLRLGIPVIYHTKNPLDYMRALDMPNTTNMFERRVSEYQMSSSDQNIDFKAEI